MKVRTLVIVGIVCMGFWILLRRGSAEPPDSKLSEAELERRADVMQRHEQELRERPDVLGLLGSLEEIIIVTDRPESLPKEIEGVPVKTVPPPPVLPPPSGVIVLKPEGEREYLKDADACPPGFREETKYRWRFCESLSDPQPIPTEIMTPPIAGVPYEEAVKILERNSDLLGKLPGVTAVYLIDKGIVVETDQPGLVPAAVEGLPVTTLPPEIPRKQSHTYTNSPPIRPLHGGPYIFDVYSQGTATLTGVVLSDGKPWLITVAHLLGKCDTQPPCQVCDPPNACTPGPPAAKLNQCPHYQGQLVGQPPTSSNILAVGQFSRWTQTAPNSYASDSAAAFMDNNQTEGDGSLSADRRLERYVYTYKGYESSPMQNDLVTIVGAQSDVISGTNVYVYSANVTTVTEYGAPGAVSPPSCLGENEANFATNQFAIHGGTQRGDSGGIVLDSQGRVIGLITAVTANGVYSYATVSSKVRSIQGFDAWYGAYTINDNTFGVFDPSNGQWYLDNGNGKWDGCTSGVPTTTQDQCLDSSASQETFPSPAIGMAMGQLLLASIGGFPTPALPINSCSPTAPAAQPSIASLPPARAPLVTNQ